MLSDSVLKIAIKRLLGLPFAPAPGEDRTLLINEYKRILRSHVNTEAHLEKIIDHLLDHSMRCPPPAEVKAAAQDIKAPDNTRHQGCDECFGDGYISILKSVHTAAGDYETSYAEPCRCELGQYLKSARAERKKKAA